jgi:hypothetical protein
MNAATQHATRSQSLLKKYPGGAFAFRHPRFFAAAETVVGIWLIVLAAILCSGGYWWGLSLFVLAALVLWIAYTLQTSARTS